MALYRSIQAAYREPALTLDGASCLVPVVAEFIVPTGLAVNDVIEMLAQPANSIPASVTLACEDSDSNGTPTIALDVGYMSGAYLSTGTRTVGTDFLSASTIARAGGMASSTSQAPFLAAPSDSEKVLGIKVQAAAATLVVGAKWRLIAQFAPQPIGIATA